MTHTTLGSTFVTRGPWDLLVKVTNVLCPDGKRRTFTPTTQDADTWFSRTGRVQVAGKSVTGGLMLVRDYMDVDDDGSWTFTPYTYLKNHDAFDC